MVAWEDIRVPETVVKQACRIVNRREERQAGQEGQEMVRLFLSLVATDIQLFIDHAIQLVIVALRVQTLLNGTVDNIRQEIIGDSRITVVLLKETQFLLQLQYIFRTTTWS